MDMYTINHIYYFYISTFIWYTAARYGVPCYNSAEAAQLTREAHGGQHEATNGRAKPESDFNMEKIFRAVLVNIIIISMSDLSVHCPACPQISKSECTHPMAEKAKSPLCQPRLFSVRNWSLSKHNWASPQSKANLSICIIGGDGSLVLCAERAQSVLGEHFKKWGARSPENISI